MKMLSMNLIDSLNMFSLIKSTETAIKCRPQNASKVLPKAKKTSKVCIYVPQSVPIFKQTELTELIFLYLVDQDH